ncbi:MAG TPA: hypothetical protein PK335_09635 [Draconibacterium sp.]|nr:hypothetical protein [Draconibacterium sp.]
MNLLLRIGTIVVFFALASYSIAVITEQRKKVVSKFVLYVLSLGVFFDVVATTFMILGSTKGAFTLHGMLGYSALAAMFIDALLMWQTKKKGGFGAKVPELLHLYSLLAYIWWIIAFLTGAVLVIFS